MPAVGMHYGPIYFSSYRSKDSDEVRFRNPEEYLVGQAWRSGDWSDIDNVLRPKLRESRNKLPSKSLERLAKLYRCPERRIPRHGQGGLKETPMVSPMMMPATGDNLALVVDAWPDRSPGVDLQPLIFETMRRTRQAR